MGLFPEVRLNIIYGWNLLLGVLNFHL